MRTLNPLAIFALTAVGWVLSGGIAEQGSPFVFHSLALVAFLGWQLASLAIADWWKFRG